MLEHFLPPTVPSDIFMLADIDLELERKLCVCDNKREAEKKKKNFSFFKTYLPYCFRSTTSLFIIPYKVFYVDCNGNTLLPSGKRLFSYFNRSKIFFCFLFFKKRKFCLLFYRPHWKRKKAATITIKIFLLYLFRHFQVLNFF